MVTKTKNFYVGDTNSQDNLRNLGISNINDAGYDATDRTRLYMHYDSKAGQIQLNPLTDVYGRSNLMGGNYTFDPKGDYLNQGPFGGVDTQPIHVGSSGLDQPNSPVTGFGGANYGPDNLRIAMPSISPGYGDSTNGPSCPEGFYYYNGTCVPGYAFNPKDPNNVIGINNGPGSYQGARGVITRVITPVQTQKGALFQVVTQIQNVGHQAGKFFTKISIGQLGITDQESNSAFLQGGQTGVLYATLQMPSTIPAGVTLLNVQSDLYQSNIGNPGVTPQRDDTNQAQMPAPGTQYGMKPPRPPIPNFPVGTGNTGSFGYPYNSQGPPPPPVYPPPPYRGFSARTSKSYQGYYNTPYPYPYQQPQPSQQQQYLSPYGAQTPSPYPIYPTNYQPNNNYYQGPIQQPSYYNNPYMNRQPIQNYPYGYEPYQPMLSGPPVQDNSYDFPIDDNSDNGFDVSTAGGNYNFGEGGSINGNTDTITGANGSSITIPGLGNMMSNGNGFDMQSSSGGGGDSASEDIQSGSRHHHHSGGHKHHKKKKHHSSRHSNLATISPDEQMHRGGSTISVELKGFKPNENVSVQLYSTVNLMGMERLKQLIGKLSTYANHMGNVYTTVTLPTTLSGKTAVIVSTGSTSNKRTVDKIKVV